MGPPRNQALVYKYPLDNKKSVQRATQSEKKKPCIRFWKGVPGPLGAAATHAKLSPLTFSKSPPLCVYVYICTKKFYETVLGSAEILLLLLLLRAAAKY